MVTLLGTCRAAALAGVVGLSAAGCGGGETTVSQHATPPSDAGDAFCASGAADRIDAVLTLAEVASKREDRVGLVRQTTRLLQISKGAPVGAPCAVDALDYVSGLWASNALPGGADEVRRIRSFQRRNELRIRDLDGIRPGS